jgi:hypothetical protein
LWSSLSFFIFNTVTVSWLSFLTLVVKLILLRLPYPNRLVFSYFSASSLFFRSLAKGKEKNINTRCDSRPSFGCAEFGTRYKNIYRPYFRSVRLWAH